MRQPPGTQLCERARAFKISAEKVDGNDVAEVYQAASRAVEQCRKGEGPFFLECMTYRWLEHVGPFFDHELNRTYRTQKEVENWMERGPVKRSEERLVRMGIATPEQVAAWSLEVKKEIQGEVEEAYSAPFPEPGALFENA